MKSFILPILLSQISMTGFAQTKVNAITPPKTAASTSMPGVDAQWEYVVVSYGKTLFESPQKTLAYRTLGLSGGNEATDLESNLDIMGRFGWEVASIIGTIGGDQQIILKRKYDKIRNANEFGLIQKGKLLYLKDLSDIIERSLRLSEEAAREAEAEKNKPRLIDLDAVDEQIARKDKLEQITKAYTEAFQRLEIAPITNIEIKYKSHFSSDIVVNLKIDLTSKFLKDGNTYRRKEVKSFLENQLKIYRFKDYRIDKYSAVTISINGFIKFTDKEIEVGSYRTSNGYSDSWSDYRY